MPAQQSLAFATSVSPTPLGRAREQNEVVKDAVAQSAAQLLLINTVLKQALPGAVQTGDVALALQKTDELEHRMQDLAEDLARIGQLLARAIVERAERERELAATWTQSPFR